MPCVQFSLQATRPLKDYPRNRILLRAVGQPAWLAFERGGKGSFRRGRNAKAGEREEGGKETPTRKPLFLPSHLLIMYAKITQQWMTSCQISLAVMHLFLAFVSRKQEIWSEGTYYKKSSNAVLHWKKKVATTRDLLYKIEHKYITSFAEGNVLDIATCVQCLSEKN